MKKKSSALQLDLHGVRHEDAEGQTVSFLEDLAGKCRKTGCGINAEIITGHSPKMQQIATDVLDTYGLQYYIGGYLGLKPAIITFEID